MAGFSFYEMSWADIAREIVTTTISNNSAQKEYLTNRDPFFDYTSSGSANDSDTITFTIDFGKSRTCDTLFLKDTNLKEFELQYYNGSTWVSVFIETTNADSFYNRTFSSFTAQQARLLMKKTFPAAQEKTLGEFMITKAIGQLVGYPRPEITPDRQATNKKMLTGKTKSVFNGQPVSIKLTFENHVGNADRDLFLTLFERYEPFLVWPCGGNVAQFAHADFGYRKRDLFLVKISKGFTHTFTKNLYISGMNASLDMDEAA